MPKAENFNISTLMIHSERAVLSQYIRNYFEKIAMTDKKLYWMETELESTYLQFNYYDQGSEVKESVYQGSKWFNSKMQSHLRTLFSNAVV